MNLLVIGASGRTGRQFLELASARGHHVTAVVRSRSRLELSLPRLTVVEANPLSAESLRPVVDGHDAAVTALGPKPSQLLGRIELLRTGARALAAAMTGGRVTRVMFVSAATLFPEKGVLYAVARTLLAQQIADTRAAEETFASAGLEWTFARPPRLVPGDDARYLAEEDAMPEGALSMSFRAVAAFMLESLEQHRHARKVVGLAGVT